MLQGCVQAIVERLDAAFARIWTLDATGGELILRASAGQYTHLDGGHSRIRVGSYKIGRIAARRAPHLANDVVNDPELSDPDWARREGMIAFAGYPLLVGEELVGVLALFARRSLPDATLDVLQAVADSIALGIRRASAEHELRLHAEVAETLYRVGTAIAEVHKLSSVVQTVTDLATELVGAQFGAFFSNVSDERGDHYQLYSLSGAARESFSQFPPPRRTEIFDPTFRGSGIERHADITTDPRYGHNAPNCGLPEGHLPVRSYLAVPVVSRAGPVIGGLFFGHPDPGVFDERAERIAVGIAGQAGTAIDTVRLFELEHRLAVNFQRALLAGDVPMLPGGRFMQHYVPASDLAEVGGDWHDIVSLADGRFALTIGDVVGHDLGAAVTMGRLRNAVQLYAIDGYGPAEVLDRTERFMVRAGLDALATVLHAVYDSRTRQLTVSRAGHPFPLIAGPDGTVEQMSADLLDGALLGIGVDLPRSEATVEIRPGSVVVFFTDGLVERRGVPIDDRIAELCGVVARALRTTQPFCESIVDAMVGSASDDDVAILAMFIDP